MSKEHTECCQTHLLFQQSCDQHPASPVQAQAEHVGPYSPLIQEQIQLLPKRLEVLPFQPIYK